MSKKKLSVEGIEIRLQTIDERDYFSLSDMAKEEGGIERIRNWMRNRDTIEFLATWEQIHNPDFNLVQMHQITEEIGLNRFLMSPQKWADGTGAIGLVSKRGRYGGVYAHKDIAYHFAMWLSPRFSLLMITEFDRLKSEESDRQKLEWSYQRFLSKVNYRLHTDSIRDHLIPKLQAAKPGQWLVYADEADLLNKAVFGLTAKEWREANPDLVSQGNMRDFADIIQLNVLANLESLNAVMIEAGT
ncbi:MAG: KilA-N domain-containing protein, partial [Bacteroidia bacterium]